MGRKFIFRRNLSGDEIMNMETMIGAVLRPVAPRQEFVNSLRQRVLAYTIPQTEKVEKQAKKNIAVLVLSLMGVSIILGVWIRVVVSLLKLFEMKHTGNERPRRRRISPAQSVA